MMTMSLHAKRRTLQILVALAFIIIPILNRGRYSYVYGNFLSFHMFGIPLADPLAVLQLTVKNFYWTLDNLIGTLIPLAVALLLGTVFCSWACPFGLLSELTQGLAKRLLPKGYEGLPLRRNGSPLKLAIFAVGFVLFFVFSVTPILNQLSLPAWYARFFQYLFGQDAVSLCFLFILAVLGIEFITRRRLWCRYICPQSVIIGLVKQLNRKRLRVEFDETKCRCKSGRDLCRAACSLGLEPKQVGVTPEMECTNCGDCVNACTKVGKALNFRLGEKKP